MTNPHRSMSGNFRSSAVGSPRGASLGLRMQRPPMYGPGTVNCGTPKFMKQHPNCVLPPTRYSVRHCGSCECLDAYAYSVHCDESWCWWRFCPLCSTPRSSPSPSVCFLDCSGSYIPIEHNMNILYASSLVANLISELFAVCSGCFSIFYGSSLVATEKQMHVAERTSQGGMQKYIRNVSYGCSSKSTPKVSHVDGSASPRCLSPWIDNTIANDRYGTGSQTKPS